MSHTLTKILVHVIFSTNGRAPLLDADTMPKLFAYMRGIADNLGGALLAVNGTDNHVHLLIKLPAASSLSDFMRGLKANSSRWLNEQQRSVPFAWQTGYGAFSVSQSNVEDVMRYIAVQEQHHRTVHFQDELRAFLKKHEMEYDERYLWD